VKNPVRYRTRVQSLLYRAITLTGPVQLSVCFRRNSPRVRSATRLKNFEKCVVSSNPSVCAMVPTGKPVCASIRFASRTIRAAINAFAGTVAKLAMRQPFVLFKGLTFQKLCLPGAFRPGDHHNKMLRPGLCVVHASPQYL
jgi:hypothetical protein